MSQLLAAERVLVTCEIAVTHYVPCHVCADYKDSGWAALTMPALKVVNSLSLNPAC